MNDRSGQQVDRYRLLRLLGSGGFGEVYLAEHNRQQRQVAIKLLPSLAADDLHSFLTEARTFRLRHPHIVQILDFGLGERTPFLVMEYAPHGTLRQCYPKGTCVPLSTIVSYVKQVASALQLAHDDGIIHRDVKPENMLLNERDEVLLSDFGIATIALKTGTHNSQHIVGTTTYMAPELFRGKAKPASDQYALGIVVYEWLCGTPPFTEGGFIQLGFQHTYHPPPSLLEKVPSLPADINRVVMIALAKDETQRWASVQAFATALEEASPAHRILVAPVLSPPITPTPLPAQEARQTAFPSQGRQTHPPSQPPLPATMSSPHQDLLIASVRTASRSGGPVTPRSRRRQFPERMRLLSILAVVLLLISGGGMWGVITYGQRQAARVAHSPVQTTSSATITAAPTSYNTAAARYGVQKGFDAQHTNYNPYEHQLSPSTVSRLMKAWTASVGNNPSSPIVIDGVIYIVSEDGKLYAFKADGCGKPTCLPLWTAQTGDTLNVTTPAVVGGIVYVGSYDYKLYAFKADGCGKPTCLPLWTAQTGYYIESSPTVVGDVVYVASEDGKLYAFKADGCGEPTCSPLWTAGLDAISESTPAVAKGVVYVASRAGQLYAFKADGCGKPTCLPLWTAQIGQGTDDEFGPVVASNIVYVRSTASQTFYAFRADGCGEPTCSPLWTADVGLDAFVGSLAVAGGIVYIGSSDHTLYTFRADGCGQPDCLPLWTARASNGAFHGSPAVAGGIVYIGSSDHTLYTFRADGCGQPICLPLWTAQTSAEIYSAPAVANGVVYIGSVDGQLSVFHL